MKITLKSLAVVALVMSFVPPMSGWGNEGHRWINRAAALNMPADYPMFMQSGAAIREIEYLGPEPDRWRSPTESSLNNEGAPEHFLDMELLEGFGPLPIRRFDFYKKLGEFQREQQTSEAPKAKLLTPDKVGLQPWIVAEIWQRLIVSFREYRDLKKHGQPTASAEQTAIFYAGWLGHYVADASNPLHTTVQYNGWTGPNPNAYTTAHTIHSQFESVYVKENVKANEIRAQLRKAQAIESEWPDYLAFIQHSNELVEPLYQLEKTGAFEGSGTPQGHNFVVERMGAGAQKVSDLWYTAWKQSAVPLP